MIEEESTRESSFHTLLSDLNYLQTRLEEEHEYELNALASENQRLLAMNHYLATQLNSQHTPGVPVAVLASEKLSRPFVKRPRARRPPQLMLGADSSMPAEPVAEEHHFTSSDNNDWLAREAAREAAVREVALHEAAVREAALREANPHEVALHEAALHDPTKGPIDVDPADMEEHVSEHLLRRGDTQTSQVRMQSHAEEVAYSIDDEGDVPGERKVQISPQDPAMSKSSSKSNSGTYLVDSTKTDGTLHSITKSIQSNTRKSSRSILQKFREARDSETVEDELMRMRALIEDEDLDGLTSEKPHPGAGVVARIRWKARIITQSNGFEITFAVAILINSIFLGVEVDHSVSHPGDDNPVSFYCVGYFFTTIFLVELIFRMVAQGPGFFWEGNCLWNYLDFFIVSASLVEVVADIVYFASDSKEQALGVSNVRIFRIIRITRLIRIFRVARIVKLIRALRTLVYQILGTLRAVFWAMILMLIIIYVFAMVFAQAASEELVEPGSGSQTLANYWGSLPRSIFTLYKSIVGGVDWEIVVTPLSDIHWFWVMLFIIFISFTFFAVLNVVTGVFCQSAIESAQHDHDMVIHQRISQRKEYIKKIRRLFKDIGEDGVQECITYRSLERHISDDKVQAYFESLGLDISDAWGLFKLLDVDESHQVELEEFVDGCLRLRGEAKAMDVAKISYDNKRYRKKLFGWMRNVDRILYALANANNVNFADKSTHQHLSEADSRPGSAEQVRYMNEIRQAVERSAAERRAQGIAPPAQMLGAVTPKYSNIFQSELDPRHEDDANAEDNESRIAQE